jgi:hypothetical protein
MQFLQLNYRQKKVCKQEFIFHSSGEYYRQTIYLVNYFNVQVRTILGEKPTDFEVFKN